jgi:uncharacterized protein
LSTVPGRRSMSELRIDVADLLSHPGARRPLHLEAAVPGLGTAVARINEPVRLDLVLERVPDGIVARGTVDARWEGECSTCLRDLAADLTVGVGELFEAHPVDGDTYPIEGHEIDLEQLVRDALLLELPLAPVCARDDCAPVTVPGVLIGATDVVPASPDDAPADPRWAALSELEL